MKHLQMAETRVGKFLAPAALCLLVMLSALLAVPSLCMGQSPSAADNGAIKDAAQAMVVGNLKQAESDLASVLRSNPRDYRALNLLGMIRAQQQRNVEAEKLFKRVIQEQPNFAGAYVNLGLVYLQMSQLDDAVAQFQEALRIDPGRDDALGALLNTWRVQARADVQSGNPEKALSALMQARKASPRNPDVEFDFAMVALRMNLLPDAAEAFRGVLAVRPDDAKSLYGLGRADIGLAKYEDAAATFSRYVQLYPQDASGHYALGVSLASLEKTSEASAQFQRSVEIQPEQTESYLQLGRICLDAGDLDCAATNFNRVLSRDPRHAEGLSGLGRVEFQRKDYAKAVELLQRSIAIDPSVRQAHYYLGLAYARLGRSEDSKKELQVATSLEHEEVEKHRTMLKLLDSSQNPGDSKPEP
ncbi:MAG: tetratricopeptide repeat protein [Candidatus Acidiferrales bacterium]